jgi:hypothetical protein
VAAEPSSYEELQRMTHEQRRAHFVASVVQDPEHDDGPRGPGVVRPGSCPRRGSPGAAGERDAPTVSERRRVVVAEAVLYAVGAALP